MPSDAADLTSLIATVEDVGTRVTAMAERYEGVDDTDEVLAVLHEAERALDAAVRRLTAAQRALRGR